MSCEVRTTECFPLSARQWATLCVLGIAWTGEPPRPDHERCPGGHHMPGVMGGWHCPCPCHHEANPATPL